ncbi:uncharacterized protein LOC131941537 [Physella acuta]|uniref:uncharacterized protein LOC131941537 n=1 Tax=Physella acuta TaxID=109671 RepID=UPI0027DE0C47|nr:uncharacterized protein LOC131941537 [Physella acuta]
MFARKFILQTVCCLLVLLFVISLTHAADQCSIEENNRFDCWPDRSGSTEEACSRRGCCWKQATFPDTAPNCFYPSDYNGYTATEVTMTAEGIDATLVRSTASFYSPDVKVLKLRVDYQTESRLRIKFYDPSHTRYEVPLDVPTGSINVQNPLYTVSIQKQPFNIVVSRTSTGATIFDTTGTAPLIFSDQFLQIATKLSTSYLYGLGEHRSSFIQMLTTWKRVAFWNRDDVPKVDNNGYGTHPFFLNLEQSSGSQDGPYDAHGVFLFNSNAGEVALQPYGPMQSGAITFRALGGVLDFFIMMGPSPLAVSAQYTDIIGRPYLPPFWSLGFHLCKYGIANTTVLKDVIKRNREAEMPYDIQWGDIDYMNASKDWTYDQENYGDLPSVIEDLHNNQQRYIIIIDPAVSVEQPAGTYPPFDDGQKMDIFVKNASNEILIGKLYSGLVAFPDFFHPLAFFYWYKQAQDFHKQLAFDGLWLDMNEPSNLYANGSIHGCPQTLLDNPPYIPATLDGGSLFIHTVCPSAKHAISTHYNLHNLFGWSESNITRSVLHTLFPNKRTPMISRSTFASSGRFTGHWMGDNSALFTDMYYSIPAILNFNLLGVPFVGADICGFWGTPTPELCTRWHQLGAFYPFMRNHAITFHDPAIFPEPYKSYIRQALQLRYTLLAVLYTAFFRAHVDGHPVVRPLFYRYKGTEYIDKQFMLGDSLMVVPVLEENARQVNAFIPNDTWYDFYDHSVVVAKTTYITLDAPLEKINLLVRGGSIIPLLPAAQRTDISRQEKFQIFVAPDVDGNALGELFWDDGESLDSISSNVFSHIIFSLHGDTLVNVILRSAYNPPQGVKMDEVVVGNVLQSPTKVSLNGSPVTYEYFPNTQLLNICVDWPPVFLKMDSLKFMKQKLTRDPTRWKRLHDTQQQKPEVKYDNIESALYKLSIDKHHKNDSKCRKSLAKLSMIVGWLLVVCLMGLVALVLYSVLSKAVKTPKVEENQCTTEENNRFDCWPEKHGATEEGCISRGCCWKMSSIPYSAPFCFFPTNYNGYNATEVLITSTGIDATLVRTTNTFFSTDVKTLKLKVEYQTDTRLRIKFYDPSNSRYEVPLLVPSGSIIRNPLYDVSVQKAPFNIKVTRVETGATTFDTTDTAPLIFSDQYLQIATKLSTKYLYGLGEHRSTFVQDLSYWKRLVFWNRDASPRVDNNGYGTHPFFLNLEPSNDSTPGPSDSHGVFLLNSNAGEVALQPYGSQLDGAVTYRMLGGILDFFIVLGPTPLSVAAQFTDIIGRTYFPPFWSLGFHICKYGIHNSSELQDMIKRNRDANMPYDVQWTDIDYMDGHKDWTYDKTNFAGLPGIVQDLHNNQQRYVLMADPAISSEQAPGTYPPFDDGKQMDVFVKNASGDILIGAVWPGKTAFPDFFHPNAFQYWYKQASEFHAILPYDGLWIDMNEPSSFIDGSTDGCTNSSLDNPPFVPETIDGGSLMSKTICPSAKHAVSTHYNLHNMYGWSQANITRQVLTTLLPNKRSPLITRSSYAGSSRYTGHWLGDNKSDFEDLYYSIPGILNFNLFGISFIGADICGFGGVTTPELCTRWHQLGVFYTFMRNHADLASPAQDPGTFDDPYRTYIRDALKLRYTLLAVLYTAMFKAHSEGLPVIRPLFYLYKGVETIDRQFMWCDSLMVVPVLFDKQTTVTAYVPNDSWYDFYVGTPITTRGTYIQLNATLDHINVLLRGGSIIPLLPATERTDVARQQKFKILVALNDTNGATGELFWDDGESLDSVYALKFSQIYFYMNNKNTLMSRVAQAGYNPPQGVKMSDVVVYGVSQAPSAVSVNGNSATFSYNSDSKVSILLQMDSISYIKHKFTREPTHWKHLHDAYYQKPEVKYDNIESALYKLSIDKHHKNDSKCRKSLAKLFMIVGWLLVVCLMGLVALVLYSVLSKAVKTPKVEENQCTTEENNRFDCWPEKYGTTEEGCISRGCCWKMSSFPYSAPFCFFPTNYNGYNATEVLITSNGIDATLVRTTNTFFSTDVKTLKLKVEYQTDTRLRIKFYDPNNARYEVPLLVPSGSSIRNPLYDVSVQKAPFNIKVTRVETGATIFDTTDTAPLIFSDQYLQIATKLSTKYLYGIGEHRSTFVQDLSYWKRLVFWNRDSSPRVDNNGYGTHPFFLNLEPSNDSTPGPSDSHGVFLLNSNAGELALQPYRSSGAVTYRMLGGILDFFIVLGPKPLTVAAQFTEIVGRTYFPPFWALGYHLCKWGYYNDSGLWNVIHRNRNFSMPYDVQWTDIEYMDGYKDWTYDKSNFSSLPSIVQDLHDNQQRYVIMADPAISSEQAPGTYPPFDDGKQMDVFVKDASGDILIGAVWPGKTAFPDFFHPNAFQYWYKQASEFHAILPYDGLWIDMNEPSSFVGGSTKGCTNSSLDNPPFLPETIDGGSLMSKTICPSAKHAVSTHYNLHNMYGWSQANITRQVLTTLLPNKRSPLITRSSYAGSGRYTGHWLGDNKSDFEDLYYSIPGILNFNLFGISFIGADICGFGGVTTPELCTRWHQLGVFYTFMRNHADITSPAQDPGTFDDPYRTYIRDALKLRYTLLAVLYTAMFKAHSEGLPVIRPLFYLYKGVETIDRQFMWSDSLMVIPVLFDKQTTVTAYIPNDSWYDFYVGTPITARGTYIQLNATLDHINVLLRGGSIIPLLPATERTDVARQQKFKILVALNDTNGATGELFWDDGESLDSISARKFSQIYFYMNNKNTLMSRVAQASYNPPQGVKMSDVVVYGVSQAPSAVSVNGNSATFSYNSDSKVLNITGLDVDLLRTFTVTWS